MPTYLDRILDTTVERVKSDMRERPFAELERESKHAPPVRNFTRAIKQPGMSLVAEFKRRSPSKGQIRADRHPAGTADAYQVGGARAMSVLTEPRFFDGSMEDLRIARASCDLPMLRKDFMIHPYQVVQARAGGADAILLIVAALPDMGLFIELADAAREYGLAALIEVHDPEELDVAFELRPELIGVNQRSLLTFEVDVTLATRLRRKIPRQVGMVAESGISTRAQVEVLEKAGVDAILVGETLMRSDDPGKAAAELLGGASRLSR